jgi:hypothetical protein
MEEQTWLKCISFYNFVKKYFLDSNGQQFEDLKKISAGGPAFTKGESGMDILETSGLW